jgi:hypothetical protein
VRKVSVRGPRGAMFLAPRLPTWRNSLLLGLGWFSISCSRLDTAAQNEGQSREFTRINARVRSLQAAENKYKEPALRELRFTNCESLCEFRGVCLRAYELHVRAFKEVMRVQQSLARAELDSVTELDRARLSAALQAAQAQLAEALPRLDNCARLQGELERASLR